MVKTLVIDNFTGDMYPQINGDINSGRSYWLDVFGHNPYVKPQNLTWNESPVQIDAAGSVLTDLILAGKPRVEGGISYVYAIGHTGRVYKIQVNNPATYNPDYNNPVLLTTLTSGTPTFTRGAYMDFFGATEKIYISHDKGVTTLNFDGTGESALAGTWAQNVPKPLQQFLGKLYIGNGTNIAEIDSTGTVTTSTKLSPAFPAGTQVRDLKLTPDGNYLNIVVTEVALADITATSPDTSIISPADSYKFGWNGVDAGYTTSTYYPSIVLTSMIMYGDSQYVFGYDAVSGGVWNPNRKFITSLPDVITDSPLPNAIISYGNLTQWTSLLGYQGNQYTLFQTYGSLSDHDSTTGFWCPNFQAATGTETDVVRAPFQMIVSNLAQGTSLSGYTDNIFGTPRVYYSTIEVSNAPTTKYKLYSWPFFPTGLGDAIPGLFQTQNQLFSKKITIKEVRVYGQPWVSGNEFSIDLIGSDDQPIAGGSKTFTAGTNLTVGEDFAWYTPDCKPVYSLALRVNNIGIVNHVINKVEIDYDIGGK